MRDGAYYIKTFYSSANVKKLLFEIQGGNHEIELPIPDINLGGEEPCRFKLIIDEVIDRDKLPLGSKILGEKIIEQNYRKVLISRGNRLVYSHENEYGLVQNETIQEALKNGVLEKYSVYSVTNDVLDGEYDVQIQVFKKYPQEPQLYSDEAPPYLTDYEQKIITISIYVLFLKNHCSIRNSKEVDLSCYGGFGHLGFFMTDLVQFNAFIKKEVGCQPLNLVELFTSTDLVDKCFEEGILIITWGIKPWHYYIFADNASLDFDNAVIVSGNYRLKSDIKKLSVIPGNELINWPSCLNREWPQIYLDGEGENVTLSLHTWNGELGNELIVAYILKRKSGKIENTVPILNYSF